MSKFLSGRQPELKVGIVSYTENKTVLEVIGNTSIGGNVGIGTTNPQYKLHVDGETRIGNQTSGSGGWFRVSLRDGTAAPSAATISMRSTASSSEEIPVTQPNLVLSRGSDTLGTLLQFKNNRTGYAAVGSLATGDNQHDLRIYTGIGTEVIRVTSNGNTGINTTNPTSKLDVVGDARFTGVVTATAFIGDGSNLTNINANASVAISTTAPENPNEGDLWYSSLLGRTFVYYQDEDSSQWVDTAPFNQSFLDNVSGIGFASGNANEPSIYSTDYPTTGFFFPSSTEITLVSSGSTVLNVNSSGVNVSGVVTATSFVGELSGNASTATYASNAGIATSVLTNPGIGIATEGGTVGFGATILDFRGAGISTVTVSSGIATVNIEGGGGGGASVSIGAEPPEDPTEGDLWYSSLLGRTFIYYVDEDSSQWVDAAPFNTSTVEKTLTIGTRTEAKVLSIFGTGLEIQLRSGIGTATF